MTSDDSHLPQEAAQGRAPQPSPAPPLDYCRPLERKKRPLPWYFDPPREPELRTWWWWRIGYFASIGVLFASIAFYFGPNVILFRKLTRLGPSDFVPEAQQFGVPIVRAIKRYERDHGHLPKDLDDLAPGYLAAAAPGTRHVYMNGNEVLFYSYEGSAEHEIVYDFTPGREGWSVAGGFAHGAIPLPPVTIDPPSQPTTYPAR